MGEITKKRTMKYDSIGSIGPLSNEAKIEVCTYTLSEKDLFFL